MDRRRAVQNWGMPALWLRQPHAVVAAVLFVFALNYLRLEARPDEGWAFRKALGEGQRVAYQRPSEHAMRRMRTAYGAAGGWHNARCLPFLPVSSSDQLPRADSRLALSDLSSGSQHHLVAQRRARRNQNAPRHDWTSGTRAIT